MPYNCLTKTEFYFYVYSTYISKVLSTEICGSNNFFLEHNVNTFKTNNHLDIFQGKIKMYLNEKFQVD